jgi:hypothetical protein
LQFTPVLKNKNIKEDCISKMVPLAEVFWFINLPFADFAFPFLFSGKYEKFIGHLNLG